MLNTLTHLQVIHTKVQTNDRLVTYSLVSNVFIKQTCKYNSNLDLTIRLEMTYLQQLLMAEKRAEIK